MNTRFKLVQTIRGVEKFLKFFFEYILKKVKREQKQMLVLWNIRLEESKEQLFLLKRRVWVYRRWVEW